MPVLASSQQEFSDADWRAVATGDQSKKLKLLLSGISANTTRVLTMPDADVTISAFVATLLDDTTAAAFLTTLGIPYTAGSYTPTGTAGTNVSSVTPNTCRYLRLGNFVFVVGRLAVDPVATGAATFKLSVPVTASMSSFTQLGGVAVGEAFVETWAIFGSATDNDINFSGLAVTTANHNVEFVLGYLVS